MRGEHVALLGEGAVAVVLVGHEVADGVAVVLHEAQQREVAVAVRVEVGEWADLTTPMLDRPAAAVTSS